MPSGRYKTRSSPQLPTITPMSDRKYSRMKKYAEKMRFERTGLVPDGSEEYTHLKIWYKEMVDGQKEAKMQQNDIDMNMAKAQNREVARVFGGKTIGDGNLGILGINTVWARGWTATEMHPQAPWPSSRELREEGDERHTSNYGRFLPIPRVPGNKTVVYKQKSWAPVEPFDAVMPVPKLYGIVNMNMFGFFSTEVDHNGVPYDDHDLPGEEYIIKRNAESTSTQSKRKVVSQHVAPDINYVPSETTDKPAFDFGPIIQQISGQNPYESTIQATAAPFVPRNIPALNPGRTSHAELEYAGDNPDDDEAFKRDFFGPVYDAIKQTPSGHVELRPDALGFTDPWKTKHSTAGSFRVRSKFVNVDGNGSPVKPLRRPNVAKNHKADLCGYEPPDISPAAAFRHVNGLLDYNTVLNAGNPTGPNNLESPIQFRKTQSFSSGKVRAHRPAPLNLKPRHYADVVKDIETDTDDQEDGGVKLL